MASTTFIDNQTIIYAAWLNDVNNAVYNGVFPNGVLNPTTLNCTGLNATNATLTNATLTNATITNLTATIGTLNLANNWAIVPSAGKLSFVYNGTTVGSISTTGNLIALANTTAGGTP